MNQTPASTASTKDPSHSSPNGTQLSIEQDLLDFLLQNPDFFERHASAFAKLRLRHPHSGRAISLQERQAQILRDQVQAVRQQLQQLMRHTEENTALDTVLLDLAKSLLHTNTPDQRKQSMRTLLTQRLALEEVSVFLWHEKKQTDTLTLEFQAWVQTLDTVCFGSPEQMPKLTSWLPIPENSKTLILLPLRSGSVCIGILLLASCRTIDGQTNDIGIEFLQNLGSLCAAALDPAPGPTSGQTEVQA